MAQIRYDSDADLDLIRSKTIAIIGFGSQGHAHALNLHDSGANIIVGLREGSASKAKAEAAGLKVLSIPEACKTANVIMLLAPDTRQPQIYERDIAPNLEAGDTLMFAHGFNIRYGTITPPADIDISMIAPKGPGHRVRETFQAGAGVPSLLAIHQDASGQADALALSYAKGIGGARAGVITTTFEEETETDLFGEQAVLCGGASELVKAGFETLVEAGYQPEIAYFECLHELKLIVDLMYRGGLSYMRYSISDTAEYGDYVSGRRIINDGVKDEMRAILADIKSGSFAEKWIAENQAGRPSFDGTRSAESDLELEAVGRKLREMMPFVEAAHPPKAA
ncbi:MAG: ketol-acid reductoisomerase [Proteobacteria bacterium]|nr:ketol-acid reductoisomerase [Pseudomonadota bacterium]